MTPCSRLASLTFVGPSGSYLNIYKWKHVSNRRQNFGGVPFAIPAGPNNYWAAAAAANFGPGTVCLTIPVGVSGVTSVFTVLNTMWGWAGPNAYNCLWIRALGACVDHRREDRPGTVDAEFQKGDNKTHFSPWF